MRGGGHDGPFALCKQCLNAHPVGRRRDSRGDHVVLLQQRSLHESFICVRVFHTWSFARQVDPDKQRRMLLFCVGLGILWLTEVVLASRGELAVVLQNSIRVHIEAARTVPEIGGRICRMACQITHWGLWITELQQTQAHQRYEMCCFKGVSVGI